MTIKKTLSKGSFMDSLKNARKLRFQVSHGAILSFTALFLIIFIAFTIRVLPMRWEIPNNALGLSEFDSFFEFSLTSHMVQYGLVSPYYPHPWINYQQNYPWGLDMSSSLPSVPITGAVIYDVLSFFGVKIDLMTLVSLLPAVLGALAVLVTYFVGKDMGGKAVGLFAALFMALGPTFISRTSIGFYETENVGILSLVLFIFFFLRAIEQNRSLRTSMIYSVLGGLALAYFAGGWGGAYYLTGFIALFTLVLILMRRYSQRLLISYSLTFGVGLFIAINIPYLSPHYLLTLPVVPIAGVFVLLCLSEALRQNLSMRTKSILVIVLVAALIVGFAALWRYGEIANIAGKFISVANPFTRSSNPLINSVAEHRLTAWGSIYTELGVGILFLLVGLFFALRNPTNRNVFLIVLGLTTLYFASSMVRLLILLDPAFALIAAVGIMGLLKPFMTLLKEAPQISAKAKRGMRRVGKEYCGVAILLIFILLTTNLAFSPQTGGTPRVYSEVYTPITISAASLPIGQPSQPIPQWLNMVSWMRTNLPPGTVVASWWDYGEWLSVLGNVTTLIDNTTENATQIENVAYAFMANETQGLKMLREYNVTYVLVFVTLGVQSSSSGTGATAGFQGFGDEGKWTWMAQISGEAESRFLNEGFMTQNYSWTNQTTFGGYSNSTNRFVWNEMGLNSTVYKLMSSAESAWVTSSGLQLGASGADTAVAPTYYNATNIAGQEIGYAQLQQYGGLIPLVALYKIDWAKYLNDTGTG
jgi:dolichyl-diphosphooligosaccharide--protein glycosyltransferase